MRTSPIARCQALLDEVEWSWETHGMSVARMQKLRTYESQRVE